MSEESKGTTQTAPPADTPSAHRKPSAKDPAWEKNTLQPTLEKNPERQVEFTSISGYPIRRFYTHAHQPARKRHLVDVSRGCGKARRCFDKTRRHAAKRHP